MRSTRPTRPTRSTRRTTRTRRRAALLAVAAALAATSCRSGESILSAGNETPPVTTPPAGTAPAVTAAPGETLPPTTTTIPPTTTTTPLEALPPCPTDALPDSRGPVELVFWHGLNAESENALIALTDEYNAAQSRVRVELQNQGGYSQTVDKYIQTGTDDRPNLVMFPEWMVQQMVDSDSVIPVGACIESSGFDVTPFQPSVLATYATEGVQWAMPFNVSNPVLYYNKRMFEAAGLDPEDPPTNLEELRGYSQQIVDSGTAPAGLAIDSGADSGGGWFLEQWFANAGEFYADNLNGRAAPATRVLYDGPAGVELMTFVQQMLLDGIAVNVGDNTSGQDHFLRMASQSAPAAMTIGTSAALGTVTAVVDAGLIPGITGDDIGVGPLPGPGPEPTALVGGASLYIVADKGDAEAAAAWDFITYVVSAQSQSTWAAATGYVPVRADALELDPVRTKYTEDPRYRVAYDQLVTTADDPSKQGPILGPQREVREVTARGVAEIYGGGDVQTALSNAAAQANALIADYAARN
jgi:sn-glycerol 3-phosphate transport system substrate-binding protein